jgi:hypothetical protein
MTQHPALDRPIILIGTHRSGTTWLGDLLGTHPSLAYWVEPRHVWTWGHAKNPHDRLTAADATPKVRAHIHRAFADHVAKAGRERLCEKTPSNCLRVPFIHALFPDARFLLVLRDGRSVIRSTSEIMAGGVPTGRILQRALQTPPWEWPAYAAPALKALRHRISGKSLDFWGPRPPGWQAWVASDPQDVVLAKQWAATLSTAVDDVRALPPGSALEFRFEHMVAEPRQTMQRLVDFMQLPEAGPLVERAASTADARTLDKWRTELDQTTLDLIRPHMLPLLTRLGYTW